MNFDNLQFASIDFESTGHREGIGDEPIQVGIAVMEGVSIDTKSFFRTFIKPSQENEITGRSQSVHRIREEDLTNAPLMYELWPKINGLLKKRVVVAHGAGTEKRFLRAFPMHGFEPWIDTLQLAKKIIPTSTDYSLGSLITEYCSQEELKELCPNLTWHDALYDAVANLILLKELLKMVEGKVSYQEILKF
ncbi:MAG: DNA polymerase III subunit epsilon [Verrucomicrobiales bacterium]|nr:DNA polymerase III subunit epsilon [Verrucomicrobiales bacterium]MBD29212.1 DNA polymerase III subunit epsilon [Verrucomicrobiaceae bacterium]MBV63611.1 DNA polymerase III subunit epsilon [Rickettsiales bacterium]|tara:strand:+ start:1245 stop:1820 length:576 start_codon:yes stop_codon:yes gene_type:complete